MHINSRGGQHAVTNRMGDTITLLDDEIAALVQGDHRILGQIESSLPKESGFQARETTPVQDIVLGLDAQKIVVILHMLLEEGTKQAFTINPKLVGAFRDSLTNKIEQIETANQSRQTQ